MEITARDLLQANVTVIAGILILLGLLKESNENNNLLAIYQGSIMFLISSITFLVIGIRKLPENNINTKRLLRIIVKFYNQWVSRIEDLTIPKYFFI